LDCEGWYIVQYEKQWEIGCFFYLRIWCIQ